MTTYKIEDWSHPVTVTTCANRTVTYQGPLIAAIEDERISDTGMKVTITQEMPNEEGTVTHVYRYAAVTIDLGGAND